MFDECRINLSTYQRPTIKDFLIYARSACGIPLPLSRASIPRPYGKHPLEVCSPLKRGCWRTTFRLSSFRAFFDLLCFGYLSAVSVVTRGAAGKGMPHESAELMGHPHRRRRNPRLIPWVIQNRRAGCTAPGRPCRVVCRVSTWASSSPHGQPRHHSRHQCRGVA